MSKLIELQKAFQGYLQTGQESPFIESVVDTHPMTAQRRLKVYQEAYHLRLQEALQIDFPKVETLLGCEAFEQASLRYIDCYPSETFSVRYFGARFEQFLKECDPYKDFPFLAEMANLEWSLMESLDAQDASPLDKNVLSTYSPEDWGFLQFTLNPSVHDRTYAWDTVALWKDIDKEAPAREPIKLNKAENWLFWHKDLRSKFESLNPIQVLMYKHIQKGHTLAEVAEQLCLLAPEDEVPTHLIQNIQYWIEESVLCGFKLIKPDAS